MSKKLYVGNLSWNTTDQSLFDAFTSFGEIVEAKVIMDRYTNRSRGFGFVTFSEDDAAERAIQERDGSVLDGRNIRVNEAQEKQRRNGGGNGGNGGNRRPREQRW